MDFFNEMELSQSSFAFFVIFLSLIIFWLIMNLLNSRKKEKGSVDINKINELQLEKMSLKLSNDVLKVNNENTKIISDDFKEQLLLITQSQKNTLDSVDKKMSNSANQTSDTLKSLFEKISLLDHTKDEITKLSSNVIDLEKVLSNKQARGAFGEMQLDKLMGEIFSNYQYKMQYKLSNDTRVDCALTMPNDLVLGIDSKFPLESYRNMDSSDGDIEFKKYLKQFKVDIKKHIDTISNKYIISGETSDYSVMFLPSDAIFFELSDKYFDLLEYSQKKKVLIVSPSTIISILLATHALLKDEKMQKQIGKVKDLISGLSVDFDRFEKRFGELGVRQKQSAEEYALVQTSFNKIKSKTIKLETLNLDD
jgi:DNA recombination protein RmuC